MAVHAVGITRWEQCEDLCARDDAVDVLVVIYAEYTRGRAMGNGQYIRLVRVVAHAVETWYPVGQHLIDPISAPGVADYTVHV